MTTIAWDGQSLASDSLCVNGHIASATMRKIGRGPGGELAGAAGDAGFNRQFIAWVESGRHGPSPEPKLDKNDCTDFGFVVLTDGNIELHENAGVSIVRAPFYACGSGRDVALGAMAHGATAEQAVQAAISLDIYSGGEITVLTREG